MLWARQSGLVHGKGRGAPDAREDGRCPCFHNHESNYKRKGKPVENRCASTCITVTVETSEDTAIRMSGCPGSGARRAMVRVSDWAAWFRGASDYEGSQLPSCSLENNRIQSNNFGKGKEEAGEYSRSSSLKGPRHSLANDPEKGAFAHGGRRAPSRQGPGPGHVEEHQAGTARAGAAPRSREPRSDAHKGQNQAEPLEACGLCL